MAQRLIPSYMRRTLLTTFALSVFAAPGAMGQAKRSFVAGEIVLYCQPGTALTRVNELAQKVGAEVTPLLLEDCYKLKIPGASVADRDTLSAVSTLKMESGVRWVDTNRIYLPLQSAQKPNDPRYKSGEQYAIDQINLPLAWSLQKGSPNVTVAVIDTGFQIDHEDMVGRFSSGSFDISDNDADASFPIPAGATDPYSYQHGQFCAGIIGTNANNGIGIAGVNWANTKVMALKAYASNGTRAGFSNTDLLNSYAYIDTNRAKYNVKVLNMSYIGGGNPADTNAPEYVALKKLYDAGVVLCAGAGNSFPMSNSQETPAGYSFVLSIGSTNRKGIKADYSQIDKVDLVAPGGEQSTGAADGVISTLGTGYAFGQGTSFATPHAAGVFGLMMSVPGVTRASAIKAVEDTATRTNVTGTLPDRSYGYGQINAYQALLKVSTVVVINDPTGLDANGNNVDTSNTQHPIETFRPKIKFTTSNIDPANIVVKIDGVTVSPSLVQAGRRDGAFAGQYIYEFEYLFTDTTITTHTIVVTGTQTDTTQPALVDTRQITIRPKTLTGTPITGADGVSRNLAMISVPYFEGTTESPTGVFREFNTVLPGATLYRYIYATDTDGTVRGRYAIGGPGTTDPQADKARFRVSDATATTLPNTATAGVLTDQIIPDARPLGIGYFANLPSAIPVITYGKESTLPIRVTLHDGWNIVGDPFPYPVAFNSIQIDTGGSTAPIGTAVDRGTLLPFLYRYANGSYEFSTLPSGNLMPWEGHWVFVKPLGSVLDPNRTITMIVPPVQSAAAGRAASSATQSLISGAGSWAIRLEARTKSLVDGNNIIGLSTASAATSVRSRAPKPPKPTPYVSLGILSPDDQGAQYAQYLLPTGGTKQWDVVVNTDQPNADVTVTWPAVQPVPRNYRLVLTDKATGQTVDMRQNASYTFNSGRNAAARQLTIAAAPTTTARRVSFSNVFITPRTGRSDTAFEIGYTVSQDVKVEVSILGTNGRTLALVGGATRAAASGDNHVVWNGRTATGQPVSAGVYVLQLKAVTTDGGVSRETRSFLVTR